MPDNNTEQYWVVNKWDGAILGLVSGEKGQQVVEGPFDTYDAALDAKQGYQRCGAHYYCVVESPTRPPDSQQTYEFVDAAREFDDVGGY